jgi:hypothetical protein
MLGASLHQSAAERARTLVAAVQDTNLLGQDVGDIRSVLTKLTAGTRFSNRVNINRPVEPSALNVYVLAHNLADRWDLPEAISQSNIFGNCAFVGVSNTIICDPDFLGKFLVDHGVFNEVPDASLQRARHEYQYAFLAWVLGHEIGHVVAGAGAAHFGEVNALERKKEAAIALSRKSETEADLFAATKIEVDKGLTLSLEEMLVALIDQEVAEKNGKSPAYGVGLHWDYANKRIVQYFDDQDHPEFVIRATRILAFIASDTHEDALKALVDTFSRHLVQVKTERQ